MPFNGAGVYSAPAADFPAVTQTVISSTHYNNIINDIATGLSLCLTKDGQQTATANIPFGGFRATNVGITAIAGSVGTPAINVSDTQTGLYRSAASELAVTVAGTQKARFDSTGLIVTGAASVSTTLTASTSVVTPLVGTDTAVQFGLKVNGTTRWVLDTGAGFAVLPIGDNTQNIGAVANRIANVFTPIIDSGTTGSLSFKTSNGTTQLQVEHIASAVNFGSILGNAAGTAPGIRVTGADTDIGWQVTTKGAGTHSFATNNFASTQLQVLHTASANRNVTITGSNGGNPTIGVTAGSLAITPAVVMASILTISGASLFVGTTPALTGAIALPNSTGIFFRNQANSSDFFLIRSSTINSVNDIVQVGGNIGLQGTARSGGAAPTTSDIPSGQWAVWRDTGGATTKLYYNNAGAIQSVALT